MRPNAALRDALVAVRLARDLPAFLRQTTTVDAASTRIGDHLLRREDRLIEALRVFTYARPSSPYARLLRHAGCELGDARALIQAEGVEAALRQLARAGVYLTYDEYKGRSSTVRGSATFQFSDAEFDNPREPAHLLLHTSGTGGRPTRVQSSLSHAAELADGYAMVMRAHGIEGRPHVVWLSSAPARLFISARLRLRLDGWFFPVAPQRPLVRWGTAYLRQMCRLAGYDVPPARYMDLRQPDRMLDWLVRRQEPTVVVTIASCATRVAVAAKKAGRSLEHITFVVQSEPLTTTRRSHIEAVGARAIGNYGTAETRAVAYSCPHGAAADDLHVLNDSWVVYTRPRAVVPDGPVVEALMHTSLSLRAPKLHLNVETGDVGRIDQRDCGCELARRGMTTHVSDIRSFEKLTGEGTTFAHTALIETLETVLPSRFGGTGDDYQLAEIEERDGLTRFVLRISPAVGHVDEAAARSVLLGALAASGPMGAAYTTILERAQAVVIARELPVATRVGKVLPLQLARMSNLR